MRSRLFACALAAIVPLITLAASPAFAQDIDAAARWMDLKIVHYRVVGEFSGEARILGDIKSPFPYLASTDASVTDRVEIEFDWDQEEMKLTGKPAIRNFPTNAGALAQVAGCPATKVEGVFEFATVLVLKDGAALGTVGLDIRRDYVGGATPRLKSDEGGGGACGDAWDTAAPKSVTDSDTTLGVPPAMMLAMPSEAYPLSEDGKSIILKKKGWTWTFTPTPGA